VLWWWGWCLAFEMVLKKGDISLMALQGIDFGYCVGKAI
jgi:hypothetical protein